MTTAELVDAIRDEFWISELPWPTFKDRFERALNLIEEQGASAFRYTQLTQGLGAMWESWADNMGLEPSRPDEPDWRGHFRSWIRFKAMLDQAMAELDDE